MSTDQAKKQHSSAVSVGTFLEFIPVDNPRITVALNQTLSMASVPSLKVPAADEHLLEWNKSN